ncbi:hypothetical protein BJV82DRAFT_716438 [Fennellomyces sp. T-0311]|nr:hypothetical protein BJV82DRAFT_716438 [Fennellomyces sp. T-0311]
MKIADDDGYLDAQKWRKKLSTILLTEDVQEHWLRVSQGNRASNELRMSNIFATDFAQVQGSSSSSLSVVSSSQQPSRKRNRDTDKPNAALTAQATDGIILQNGRRSVGFVIKDEAARRYYDYHSCKPAEKSIISLGINGILDLGNDKVDSQISLFHKEEWDRLSEIFPAPKLADHHVVKGQPIHQVCPGD